MKEICQKCKVELDDRSSNFCTKCGADLTNYCTNQNACPNWDGDDVFPLGRNDKYCGECGSESTFSKNGYFND